MKGLPIVLSLLCASAFAQGKFTVKDGSKNYDVRVEVATCDAERCEGPVTFTLFRKGQTNALQTFKLEDSSFLIDEKQPTSPVMAYEKQSAFTFEDYNFDGIPDLALCDGNYSGYGGQSFQVYLFAPRRKLFVLSPGFTRLAQSPYMGIFQVDRKRKVLANFSKSGCCLHQWEEYAVVNNRPRKIFEKTEDATDPRGKQQVTTTVKRLVNGRWQTKVQITPKRRD
ncbi:MAG TPA: hypothetical protein VJT71_06995 [Pyrinomonadaceae bacterium]|nr:hypothetical protein [Pyrinomonadaceae bacterium]